MRRLLERIGPRVLTGQLTHRIERRGKGFRVLTTDTEWLADIVIVAAPLLVATRIVESAPLPRVTYSPWFTANLTLDRWPRETGFPVAWDNVIYGSQSLGYVVATHQQLRRYVPRTVWTYYWALAHQPAHVARQWLLNQDWATLREQILTDLSRAHPDIRDCVTRWTSWSRPCHDPATPGLLADPAWRALRMPPDRLLCPLRRERAASFRGSAISRSRGGRSCVGYDGARITPGNRFGETQPRRARRHESLGKVGRDCARNRERRHVAVIGRPAERVTWPSFCGASGVLEYSPTGCPAGSLTIPMAPVPLGGRRGIRERVFHPVLSPSCSSPECPAPEHRPRR